jgi:uncharacterized protein (UPF0261 family)
MTLREHLFHLAGRLARLTGEIAAAATAALRREISARMASDTVLAIMAGEGTALIIPLPELALHAGLERRGH